MFSVGEASVKRLRVADISGVVEINGQSIATFGGGEICHGRLIPATDQVILASSAPSTVVFASNLEMAAIGYPFINDVNEDMTLSEDGITLTANTDGDYEFSLAINGSVPDPDMNPVPTSDSVMVVRLMPGPDAWLPLNYPLIDARCQIQPAGIYPGEFFANTWGTFSCNATTIVRLAAGQSVKVMVWINMSAVQVTILQSSSFSFKLLNKNNFA
jgi:hypothetical protein